MLVCQWMRWINCQFRFDINYPIISNRLKFFYFTLRKVKLLEIALDNCHYSFFLNFVVKILSLGTWVFPST